MELGSKFCDEIHTLRRAVYLLFQVPIQNPSLYSIPIGTGSFFGHAFLFDEKYSTYGVVLSMVTSSSGSPYKSWTSLTIGHACIDPTPSCLGTIP